MSLTNNNYFYTICKVVLLLLLMPYTTFGQQKYLTRISFVGDSISNDTISLRYYKNAYDELKDIHYVNVTHFMGKLKWEIKIAKPLYIGSIYRNKTILNHSVVEPGDDVTVHIHNDKLAFSGRGAEKYKLENELANPISKMAAPGLAGLRYPTNITSLEDYDRWLHYFNRKDFIVDSILLSFKNKVSRYAYEKIKYRFFTENANLRVVAISTLMSRFIKESINNLTRDQIINLSEDFFKSHAVGLALKQTFIPQDFVKGIVRVKVLDRLIKERVNKSYLTNYDNLEWFDRHINEAKNILNKNDFEYYLKEFMMDGVIHDGAFEKGWLPEYDKYLNAYYTGRHELRFKQEVKNFEKKERRSKDARAAYVNQYLNLPTASGTTFNYKWLKSKTGMIYFWKSGKPEYSSTVFSQLYEKFKNDTNVVFITISAEKDKRSWTSGLKSKGLSDKGIINLYAEGKGKNHALFETYIVDNFPLISIVDTKGVVKPVISSVNNYTLTKLTKLLNSNIDISKDGPYVFYNENHVAEIINIYGKTTWKKKVSGVLPTIESNIDPKISINLKSSIVEPAIFPTTEKLLVLSDIEGNYEAFKQLLLSGKVIDENLNWIFSKGHLVFAGDMFDRGEQVTECLWLMYGLEEKAKAAGGHVHFILGNHEIMNLQGDHRYVQEKYKANAQLVGKSLTEMYNENSELGRWLRTKNIVEKIGDLLFAHGGISNFVLESGLSLEEINKTARPFYADTAYSNKQVKIIMDTRSGPFWYRGYYQDNRKYFPASMAQIDSTLRQFKVNHIITGHTIVSNVISTHFNNKIINTDTRHAAGKSEALLIEGRNFYRVNDKGQRWLLFKDPEENVKSKK